MSYDGSTFIGKLEELCLSGLPLVVVVGRACVRMCVCCTVVAAELTGTASSLHSSRRQWRECKETVDRGSQEGVVADVASGLLFAVSEEDALWIGVCLSGRRELQQEAGKREGVE